MSATSTHNGSQALARGLPEQIRSPAKKKARQRHTPGGVRLGQDASREAQQKTAAILEVLAGVRTPTQAAEALGISLPGYYQLETRAMVALVQCCEPRPRGPGRSPDRELVNSRKENERLQRELARQQTLVRIAQRTIGLAPPAPSKPPPGKKKRRRPVVRALAAARYLQQRQQEEAITATQVQEKQD